MRNNPFLYALVGAMVFSTAIFVVEASAVDYTVVAFGDSTTVSDSRVPVTYADILRNELPRYDIGGTVSNKGAGSNTTEYASARFNEDVLAQNPDLVFLQFGINDSAVDVWKDPPVKQPRVSLEQYVKNLKHVIETLRKSNTAVILMTPNPLRWTPELKGMYGKPPYDPDEAGLLVESVDVSIQP
jgi:lysophospholipase L1-like esterase